MHWGAGRFSVVDLAAAGLLGCAVILTGIAIRRELVDPVPKPVVRKVPLLPDLHLVGRPLGPEGASLPIVVFADFQCPYCARAQSLIREILAAYPGRVRIMYRHLPLETIHPHAWNAALAAECAADQGAFRAYHDLLYALQDSIGKMSWTDLAARAGVARLDAFRKCVDDERNSGAVERDVLLARELEVDRTPTFVVGDELYPGLPPAGWLRSRVARALRRGG